MVKLNHYRYKSLKTRLNVAFFVVVFIPLFIITYIFNLIYTNIIINQTIENSIQNLELISKNIELLTESAENYSRMIITSKITQDFSRKAYHLNELQELSDLSVLRGTFDNLIGRKNIINSIFLFKFNGLNIYDIGNNASGITVNSFPDKSAIADIMNKNVISTWSDVFKSEFRISNNQVNTFTLSESIMDMNSGKNVGMVHINLNETALSSIYSNVKIGSSGKYLIINSNGQIMSATNSASLFDDLSNEQYYKWCSDTNVGGIIQKINGEKMLITVYSLQKLPWKIISVVPLEELLTSMDKINIAILVTGVILFLVTLLMSVVLSNRISKPILHLSGVMKSAGEKNTLNIRIEKSSNDEVGILQTSFNRMMQRILELIDTVKEEQKLKRKFELSAINAQVKPHFLYNALNSILGLLSMKDNVSASKMVKALGEFYKLSLGTGRELIPISDEIKLTESYIIIQKLKYGDKLTYTIDIPDPIKSFYLPKFSLQPLVENSFKHGFNSIDMKDMLITITGEIINDSIYLYVFDNGKGAEGLEVNKTFKYEDSPEEIGFGLKSIYDRLSLYFGNNSFIKAESAIGQGTKITIKIPMKEE